ncbi:MAG: hypothetical protein JXR64_00700 [Spirochaetales bacterium]|nr:hypothetical protein [Spirochaetales bacterium]
MYRVTGIVFNSRVEDNLAIFNIDSGDKLVRIHGQILEIHNSKNNKFISYKNITKEEQNELREQLIMDNEELSDFIWLYK